MHNFALIGAAGFVAPRHLSAIYATGNRLIAACDPNDSVGVLDRFSFDVKYFREIERFDRFLEKLRRGPAEQRVEYVSICSPNYLHDSHARLAMRVAAHAICEKPLVINPWNLDALQEIEEETGRRVFAILQLRLHPSLVALRDSIRTKFDSRRADVVLTYITGRGGWYDVSWKGSDERSGGVVANIGIHFFDLLLWLFGSVQRSEVHIREQRRASGYLELENANVRWYLSVNHADLPLEASNGGQSTWRSITVDGEEMEFTRGFTDLHTRVYERTLAGEGFGLDDARPSIELVYGIRMNKLASTRTGEHPMIIRTESNIHPIGALASREV
jgi:UDP-N-acetyl-2-amino-2-deoxyglucuronate dehydrogenase